MAKVKQKGGKEVLYRLVMAVLAVCVPIAAYFCDYVYVLTESSAIQLLSQLAGYTEDTGETEEFLSLYKLQTGSLTKTIESYLGEGAVQLPESLNVIKPAAIAFVVCFVLAAVLAVVLLVFAIVSKKKTVPMCIAGAGILVMIAMYISFHYVAAPFLDGTITLSSFLSESVVGTLLGGLITVSVFRLTTGYFIELFLFIAMLLWAGANKLVELGDKPPKAKKEKAA